MGLTDRDVSILFEIFDFGIESACLSLGVPLLLEENMDVFILLVYLIQLKVSSANLLDLLDHMLLDRIVVEKNFCDGLIDFEGVFEVFAYFSSEEIVAEAQTLEGCEWTLYHVIEFLGNVLRLNLAF